MRKPPYLSHIILLAFLANTLGPVPFAQAQDFYLPAPGVRIGLSPEFNPPVLKGIKVHPDNPFRFDFILDKGDDVQSNINQESTRLIKYFLASLTIPDDDLWVNLSPYEKNRIVPGSFGQTEMGRDLLAEDYMLKQITASLIYPEGETGKKFWKRVYAEAAKKLGSTNIPVNTFNKVWIVPDKAVVYENAKAGTAYVVESKLKVMLEQDYLALSKHVYVQDPDINKLGSDIVREIVIPELTKEVNEGKNFAQLRQVYNSLILASWFKKKIKDSILARVYADKKKIAGIGYGHSEVESIYQRYLQAFKKGAYNYIKEEVDPLTQQTVSRKYFSGGVGMTDMDLDKAMTVTDQLPLPVLPASQVQVTVDFKISDAAMAANYGLENGMRDDRFIRLMGYFKQEKHKVYLSEILEWLRMMGYKVPEKAIRSVYRRFPKDVQNLILAFNGTSFMSDKDKAFIRSAIAGIDQVVIGANPMDAAMFTKVESVEARRDKELEILDRQKMPVTVSQLLTLLRAEPGYGDVKATFVKNDVSLDPRLYNHGKFKKVIDYRAVAARRSRLLWILGGQKSPITAVQLTALLRSQDGFADVKEKDVRSDIRLDERLKDHKMLKQRDPEKVAARRDKLVEILDQQESPVTINQLVSLLKAEGYSDAKYDDVANDVDDDDRLKDNDKLSIRELNRGEVAARRDKLVEILSKQESPVTVEQLVSLLRGQEGYADVNESDIRHDIERDARLNHNDKISIRLGITDRLSDIIDRITNQGLFPDEIYPLLAGLKYREKPLFTESQIRRLLIRRDLSEKLVLFKNLFAYKRKNNRSLLFSVSGALRIALAYKLEKQGYVHEQIDWLLGQKQNGSGRALFSGDNILKILLNQGDWEEKKELIEFLRQEAIFDADDIAHIIYKRELYHEYSPLLESRNGKNGKTNIHEKVRVSVMFNDRNSQYLMAGTVLEALRSLLKRLGIPQDRLLYLMGEAEQGRVKVTVDGLVVIKPKYFHLEDGDVIEFSTSLDYAQISNPKGGIDFNPDKLDLQLRNAGQEIKFKMDPSLFEQLQNAPGLVPVIINIQSLADLRSFLGIS